MLYRCAKSVKDYPERFGDFRVNVKKFENSEKNSPKIGGGGQVPQFWNLSRAFSPLSPHTKIAPQDPLGEEIWGLKLWTLVHICQKLGSPPPQNLIFLESSRGGLQALKILWAKVQKQAI